MESHAHRAVLGAPVLLPLLQVRAIIELRPSQLKQGGGGRGVSAISETSMSNQFFRVLICYNRSTSDAAGCVCVRVSVNPNEHRTVCSDWMSTTEPHHPPTTKLQGGRAARERR